MSELNLTEEQARAVLDRGHLSFREPGVVERMAPDDPVMQHRLIHGPTDDVERG